MFARLKDMLGFGPMAAARRAKAEALAAAETAKWQAARRLFEARYDTAQTSDENRRHWSNLDFLSAKAANSYAVRKTLRTRSRYEVDNNCWYRGIVNRWTNYMVGRGPRLKVQFKDRNLNKVIEDLWCSWCRATGFIRKLRVLKRAKVQDGEGIALFRNNPKIKHAVQLDFQPIEADQVMTPDPGFLDKYWVDGLELDDYGNPTVYHVLKRHPGDLFYSMNPLQYDRIRADKVVHWFKQLRPGQVRGIPEMTPGLDLFGYLRRYGMATVGAAELAASISTVLKTQTVGPNGPAGINAMDQFEFERNMHVALPDGWDIFQFKPEQPVTNYEQFELAVLRQIAACVDIPFCLAIGDFSGTSYSGGRLDVQSFVVAVGVERQECVEVALDPTFNEFYEEAILIPGLLPAEAQIDPLEIPHCWFWDSVPHVDPTKEAAADQLDILSNKKTMAEVCAEEGRDWEDVAEQRAMEIKKYTDLELPPLPATPGPVAPPAPEVPPGQQPGPGQQQPPGPVSKQAGKKTNQPVEES